MKFSKASKTLIALYLFELSVWIMLTVATKHTAVTQGFLFDVVLKIFHLTGDVLFTVGGLFGLSKVNAWGGFRSAMGRVIFFISLGLITWGIGSFIWFWYLFYGKIDIPYPSIADGIYVLSWPLWGIGIWNLSRVIGAKSYISTTLGKILLFVVPVITLSLSYYLLIVVARGGKIDFTADKAKLIFDLFYPIAGMVLFTAVGIVYTLSFKLLGGRYKTPILLLFFGFLLNFISDFAFAYTTTAGTYFNGHVIDLMYATAMLLIGTGINNLDPTLYKNTYETHENHT